MSFRRENDNVGERTSRTISMFFGSHYGTGVSDQKNGHAYVADLAFMNNKPHLRDGCRKSQGVGFTGSITNIFPITLGGSKRIGIVVNGVLSTYEKGDFLEGLRKYYTWSEAKAKFHWDEAMDAHTWNSLFTGNK